MSYEQNYLRTWGLTDITETHEIVKQYKANYQNKFQYQLPLSALTLNV